MSSKRCPLQAMQSMVDQLPAPVQRKKRNSKKHQQQQQQPQQQAAILSSSPTTSNQAVPPTQVDYFPNPYQHINPWTPQEQDKVITNYQNHWGRQEEEAAVASILDDLIRDDTIEPQQEPLQEPQREPQQEPPQMIVEQEKKYDVTICPFHRCKLTTFEAWKTKEVYVKCSVDTCCLFSHMNSVVYYIRAINQKVDESYINSGCNLKCDCKEPVTLRVSHSEKNPGRPYFGCKDRKGCRFFQWGDIPLSLKNGEKQTN